MKFKLLTFILAFLLSGCSLIEDSGDLCSDAEDDGAGYVTLSFKMITSQARPSRADNATGHTETDSEWPAFENYIDANDFAFFIFADISADKQPLIMKVTDITSSSDPNMMITGSPGAYTVTAIIPRASLESELGHELSPGSNDRVNFRMVVLANTGDDHDYGALDTSSYSNFINDASEWTLNMPATIYHGNSLSSEIDKLYTGAIPMFGMKTFSATEDELYSSRPEERIWAGDINMLRSLAKIRVIDMIENRDATTGLPRIDAVSVQGRTPNVYEVPDLKWYTDGWQVESPRAASADGAPLSESRMRLGYFNSSPSVFFGYIPEQGIQYGYPEINITVTYEVDASGKPLQKTYSIPLTGYHGQEFTEFGENILRNHIYTLAVTGAGTMVKIDVEVEKWDEKKLELEYTELVTVLKRLEWEPGTYVPSSDINNCTVVMQPWAGPDESSPVEYPVVLEGSFCITNPLGSTWTAYLLLEEGVSDSFAFLDDNGVQQPHVSGLVNGSNAAVTIRIVTTNNQPTEVNSVKLQVVVTLPDGNTVIEAPMTPVNSEYKNYTIVQNPL